MATDLPWKDLNRLAVLAAQKADDTSLSYPERERWIFVADRINEGKGTANDLRAAAELAELTAALEPDAKVRQRYFDLAARAVAAAAAIEA